MATLFDAPVARSHRQPIVAGLMLSLCLASSATVQADEINLEDLQRKLNAARQARQQRSAASAARPASSGQAAASPPATAAAPRIPVDNPAPTKLRASGALEVTDAYGKKSTLRVTRIEGRNASGTHYSSGDAIDGHNRVLAVRVGTHVATADGGSLWQFPLEPGTSGHATLRFDEGQQGEITWKVEPGAGALRLVRAELVIRIDSIYRQSGTWEGEFDDKYPLPARSKLFLRGNYSVSLSPNESVKTVWIDSAGDGKP